MPVKGQAFLWMSFLLTFCPVDLDVTIMDCPNPVSIDAEGILMITIPAGNGGEITIPVCHNSGMFPVPPADYDKVARRACFENRDNEDGNGNRVYRCEGARVTVPSGQCFGYDLRSSGACTTNCFDVGCYPNGAIDTRPNVVQISFQDVNECTDDVLTDCCGPPNSDCTIQPASGANSDCYNTIGGHLSLCRLGFIQDVDNTTNCILPCGHPDVPPHSGLTLVTERVPGEFYDLDVIQIICEDGYQISDGVTTMNQTCTGAQWEPQVTCTAIDACMDNPCPGGGCQPGAFGSFICPCPTGHFWNYTTEQCQALVYPAGPPIIQNSVTIETYNTYANALVFQCDEGFLPDTQNTNRTFQLQANMNGDFVLVQQATCARISCRQPPQQPNAAAGPTDTFFNSTVTYRCNIGYEVSPTQNTFPSVCQSNGTWSSPTVNCTDINECLSDPNPCGDMRCINLPGTVLCGVATEGIVDLSVLELRNCTSIQNNCMNGGNCVMLNSEAFCLCAERFTGARCELEVGLLWPLAILGLVGFLLGVAQCLLCSVYFCRGMCTTAPVPVPVAPAPAYYAPRYAVPLFRIRRRVFPRQANPFYPRM